MASYSGRISMEESDFFSQLLTPPSPDRPTLPFTTSYLKRIREAKGIAHELDRLRKGELVSNNFFGTQVMPKVEFDTLVGTGLSGILPLVEIADELEVHWLAVRKPGENTHTGSGAEGTLGKRWLFFDDFVSSGETFARVYESIKETARTARFNTEFVGHYGYTHRQFLGPDSPELKSALRRFGPRNEREDLPW